MCHVSVGHVARGLESAGIATTTIMVEAFRHRAEEMMIPRTLTTRFPMGRPLGAPNDVDRQLDVIRAALGLLETATELESVASTMKGVEAKVVGAGGHNRRWVIQLTATNALPVGKLNGQIQLNFSSGTVNIPVIGTVKPIIQVVPDQIQFSSRSSKPTERLIMLRSGGGRPFEILSAELEKVAGSVEIEKLVNGKWQCRITIMPATIESGATLKLKTSIESMEKIDISIKR